jgi:hypothetical protein
LAFYPKYSYVIFLPIIMNYELNKALFLGILTQLRGAIAIL